jgi:hypothetical protein
MGELTLDEIDRTITLLKMRVLSQRVMLKEMKGTPFARDLLPVHIGLIENIYRMSRIRDGLAVDEPSGRLH